MNYVGSDLRTKTLVLCVLHPDLKATHRRTFARGDTDAILAPFRTPGTSRAVVEATASDEGLGERIETPAQKSPLRRWAPVEAAWRVIRQSAAWRRVYGPVKTKAGGKKAIGAVARRLLVVMAAMLRDGTNDRFLKVGEPRPTWRGWRGPRRRRGGSDSDEGEEETGGALVGVTTTGRPRNEARRPHRRPPAD